MLELSDPVILANIHLHIFSKMYLAERMKERSTLSIFSSFWYASWVGFLTWKKAKQFERTHPIENLISETQLKLPDAPAADTHHQPPYPPLPTTTPPHLHYAPDKYLHTHTGPTFPPSCLCSHSSLHLEHRPPYLSLAKCDLLFKALESSSKRTSSIFPFHLPPMHHALPKLLFLIFWTPQNLVSL